MNRIDAVFADARHKALIPFLTVGYPSIEHTLQAVPLLAGCGCDLVELGIPFSDPLADGATIQKASFHALNNGVTPQVCLEVAAALRQQVTIPLVFMTYYNPVFSYGLEQFCAACATAGVDGLIVPDLPLEEGSPLEQMTQHHGLDLIYLVAPTSTDERIRRLAESSRGFLYIVSVAGVTGARAELPESLRSLVSRARRMTTKPLCVGFGISTARQAGEVASLADGVIIGSRIIQLMEGDASLAEVARFMREVRGELDRQPLSQIGR